MKIYKITADDELAAAIDLMASKDSRPSSEYIAKVMKDWLFGAARHLPRTTEAELEEFRRDRPQRINLTAKVRNSIFERDGGKCRHCEGPLIYGEIFHIDHLIPVSKGGTNDPANLALSCVRCNLVKAAKSA